MNYTPSSFSPSSPSRSDRHEAPPSPISILIMDDEDFIRDIVGAFLAMEGYEVLEAKNGQEALEICVDAQRDGKPVGGAVFDLVIPGGPGGRDAIVDFRRIFPDMPIFASSGASADPIMEQPTEHGFTGSICKPFKMNELMALLQAHLK